MKALRILLLTILSAFAAAIPATAQTYTNFIRQTQYPTGVVWDSTVAVSGSQQSALAIDPGGARFELWTVKSTPLTSYLLDTKYVGSYIPRAWVFIVTEDPYQVIPRTRADRYFDVYVYVNGLSSDPAAPDPAKSVKFLRHVQSYGEGGTGIGIDRNLATLHTQNLLTNSTGFDWEWDIYRFNSNAVPGANRAKVRGEERFSVFSQEDYQAPSSQLASQYVQIWPVADGSITGITSGALIKTAMPSITLTMNDLYPDSQVFAKVYQGPSSLTAQGAIVPGSALIINEPVPQNRVLTLNDWDSVLTDDGQWTLDLMTTTPFGTERLATVSFTLDRIIKVNGSVTTVE
jgi:hypothetical protein